MRMSASDWGLLLLLSLLWGASFLFIGVAVREMSPLLVVASRTGLAALALWIFVAASGRAFPRGAGIWGAFLVMGVLNNVCPFLIITWAQAHIPAGLASILNATTPVFTVLVAAFLLSDERPGALRVAGVATGLAGAVTVIGPEALEGLGRDVLAQAACLLASVFYAFSSVWGRRFGRMGLDPVVTAAGMLTASSAVLIPLAAFFALPGASQPSAGALAAVAGLALLSTALAYVLFYRILASAGTSVMLVTFLIPVSAILFGTLFLGERLAPADFAGMAIIAAGLSLIDGRLWKRG
jgi:drug/metabolite transporter (DMT)-like permease